MNAFRSKSRELVERTSENIYEAQHATTLLGLVEAIGAGYLGDLTGGVATWSVTATGHSGATSVWEQDEP